MRTLDKLPEGHRIVIPCRYNSGRNATVRVTENHYDIVHISIDDLPCRPYQSIADGYLHLDLDGINKNLAIAPDAPYVGYRRAEAEQVVEAVRQININYFAGTLAVLSDSEEYINLRSRDEYPVKPLEAHLGANWQAFYFGENWIKEAEKRGKKPVFITRPTEQDDNDADVARREALLEQACEDGQMPGAMPADI